jgi:F-type H+-transporting ATPase subunit b
MEKILSIDPMTLGIQIAGFILLALVFRIFLFKPVRDVLDARRNEISGQYEEAEKRLGAADELKAQYEQHLAGIEDEMRVKINEALKEGQRMRDEVVADARERAAAMIEKAETELRQERDKALVEIKQKVVDLTIHATSRLIEQTLDRSQHDKLILNFIDELDEARR